MPIIGAVLFVVLYVAATRMYPGGSATDKQSTGFSWTQNYWCNLLDDVAINGQSNSAQPLAMAAMFVLCFSLGMFWWDFPGFVQPGKLLTWVIRSSGMLSLGTSLLLMTATDHDQVTNLASGFGLVAMLGTLIGLYQIGWRRLFLFGLLNLALVALNNYLYYTPDLLHYLPTVQKITFLSFLLWITATVWAMFRVLPPESGRSKVQKN